MKSNLDMILEGEAIRVVDVGARGDSELPFVKQYPRHVELIGFDPDVSSCDDLNRRPRELKSYHVYPYAIGKPAKSRDFYVTELEDLSSLLRPSQGMSERNPFRIKQVIKVSTTPLDRLAADGVIPSRVDVIKLDTQGSELEILESSAELLQHTLMVACEAEFFEMYEGQPRFSELELFLRSHGFELLSISQHSAWSPRFDFDLTKRKVTWADTVFVKKTDYFMGLADKERNIQLRKMVALLVSYNFFGEAMRLASHFNLVFSDSLRSEYKARNSIVGSLLWRARLIKAALNCLLTPNRSNRLKLARNVLRVEKGSVFEIGKI